MTLALIQRLPHDAVAEMPGAHLGLSWTPMSAGEAGELCHFIHEVEMHDNLRVGTLPTGCHGVVKAVLAGSGDFLVGRNRNGVLSACAYVLCSIEEDSALVHINAWTSPRWRGVGIGRAVLNWQLGRASELILTSCNPEAVAHASIGTFVEEQVTSRRRILLAAGFSARRVFRIMSKQIDSEEPIKELPQGYALHTWDDRYLDDIRQCHLEAFMEGHWGGHVRASHWWNEAIENMDKELSALVLDGAGKPAGYLIASRKARLDTQPQQIEGWVELLGVAPDSRRLGLGSILLGHYHKTLFDKGIPSSGLSVDTESPTQAEVLYQQWGYRARGEELYYALDL
ncbi:MAG: GNAT family N-acetyltransferase [Actinomycetaceae bacterium]|nr:GNAT family N-acetyltransferase [Actinomycetaceae bacterium]